MLNKSTLALPKITIDSYVLYYIKMDDKVVQSEKIKVKTIDTWNKDRKNEKSYVR